MSLVRTVRAGEICESFEVSRQLPRFSTRHTRKQTHELPVGLGVLASAEVAEGPSGVPEHADLVGLVEEGEERTKGALLENVVAALGAVSSNVAESPNGLLADVEDGGGEELDEDGDGARLDDDLGMLRGSRGDVGKGPGGFELGGRGGDPNQFLGEPRRGDQRTWIIECSLRRNSTKRATTPHSMTFSIGGLRSLERSLRNLVVASSC